MDSLTELINRIIKMNKYLVMYKKYQPKNNSFTSYNLEFVYDTQNFTIEELYKKLINDRLLDFPNEIINIVNVIKL